MVRKFQTNIGHTWCWDTDTEDAWWEPEDQQQQVNSHSSYDITYALNRLDWMEIQPNPFLSVSEGL